MKCIICLDDRNGMAFNRRRVSRDEMVTKDILSTVGDGKIYVTSYSAELFPEGSVFISDNPENEAGVDDYIFVELRDPAGFDGIDEYIIYWWNRSYPAMVHFTEDLDEDFLPVSILDFEGNSHEKITKEVWKRM